MNKLVFAAESVTLPWLLVLLVGGVYCVKHLNAKLTHAIVFIAIGVVGAATIIGTITHQGLDFFAGLTH